MHELATSTTEGSYSTVIGARRGPERPGASSAPPSIGGLPFNPKQYLRATKSKQYFSPFWASRTGQETNRVRVTLGHIFIAPLGQL